MNVPFELGDGELLIVVPARGGSKGLPGKNIKPLQGKPLIAWTIEAALHSGVGPVVVSTDDVAIAEAARQAGAWVPFMRPPRLATNEATSVEVLAHTVETLFAEPATRPGWLMLLQPTSPLRSAKDIRAAYALHREHDSAVLSVVAASKPPSWYLRLDDEGHLRPALDGELATRRQDTGPLFLPNGAIYILSVADVLAGRSILEADAWPLVMPEVRSLDIDTELDWLFVEAVLAASPR